MSGYVCLRSGAKVDADTKHDEDGTRLGRWCSGQPGCLHLDDGHDGYRNARPSWQTPAQEVSAGIGISLKIDKPAETTAPTFLSAGSFNTVGKGKPAAESTGTDAAPGSDTAASTPALALFATAREIGEETAVETPWLARPWIARGSITELDGKLKASGKTTWLLALISAVVAGRPFMGEPTVQTPVVYLTEQAGPSLRDALRRAELLGRDDVVVMRWAGVRGVAWDLIVALAAQKADEIGASLLAVDTLGQFTGLVGDAENNSGSAMQAMAPLQVVAASGIGVLLSRHERKGGGEVGESARGSSAYSGAVDVVLSLQKPLGNQGRPSIRVIKALSRFDDTPDELVIELSDGQYHVLGTAQDVAAQSARRSVLETLPTTADDAVDMKALLELLTDQRIKRTTMLAVLEELLHAGTISRIGGGKRGNPYRWFHGQETDSAGPPVEPTETYSLPYDDDMEEG